MVIDSVYGAESLWEVSEIRREQNRSRYSGIAEQTTASGDSVDISDEARKLYSKMIHKYDKSARIETQGETGDGSQESTGGAAGGSGGAGAAGESSSGDEVETLKKQIQALKSQLMALASQAGNSGSGNAAMEKMNALQSQIAALEAQLNAMEQAA